MSAGKGSRQRPTDTDKFNAQFDRIFKATCEQCGKPTGDLRSVHTCSKLANKGDGNVPNSE